MSETIETKLKPSVRTSGGNPTGLPDYKPFNKLPRDEFKALLKKTLRPALYQVRVEDRKRGDIAVGPKCPQDMALSFAQAIFTQVKLGREKDWANPRVVLVL